jgi:SAM-dependent methyltransferase
VPTRPANERDRAAHWSSVYERNRPDAVSWYQRDPVVSLELIEALGLEPETAVIDVGGGTSPLLPALLARGFADVTVLDIADAALEQSRAAVGEDPRAHWITADVLTWVPPRRYGLWHDRAVLHFFTGDEVLSYRRALHAALSPGGAAVLATFAPDGPEQCSGLPVTRYGPQALAEVLGEDFELAAARTEDHTTPAGAVQRFTWIVARRSGSAPPT